MLAGELPAAVLAAQRERRSSINWMRAAKQYRGKGTVVFVPGNHQGPPKNHHRPSVGTLVIFCYLSAFSILFKCKGGELL